MKRITHIGFVLGLLTLLAGAQTAPPTSAPSTDQSSLGTYARAVRKDPAAKAKPKVYDNDNLPTEDKLSVVGDTVAANAANNTAAPGDNKDASATKPAASPDDDAAKKQAAWKDWQGRLTTQKGSIDLASRELDVLQKEYQLRAAAMYADVGNRMRNAAEWDKEDADYKQKIADKQKAVNDAKQKLDDMQEEARKAGVPAAMRE
jgi:hypothetical protein